MANEVYKRLRARLAEIHAKPNHGRSGSVNRSFSVGADVSEEIRPRLRKRLTELFEKPTGRKPNGKKSRQQDDQE